MDKKISYCPRCDKYVERFVWFCPFCGGMVPKVSVWEKWDDAKRQEFFKDSPHYDPPRPTNDKAELEKQKPSINRLKKNWLKKQNSQNMHPSVLSADAHISTK